MDAVLRRLSAGILVLLGGLSPALADDNASRLYAAHKQSVVRVDVLAKGLEKKTSLGTGFTVVRPDLLATNFHVVADAVHEPERFRLEWENVQGERGALKVVDVDVVHDLALLQADKALAEPLSAGELPAKGTALYSLGHPLALALTIVPGTNNGLMENSLYEKIHFSGNINSGMSGGPVLNAEGQVVGINVSHAARGQAVSFLVPVHYLKGLIARAETHQFSTEQTLQNHIGEQLLANQQQLAEQFFGKPWPKQTVGRYSVPAELSSRVECWAQNEAATPKMPIARVMSNCSGRDEIFLSDRQYAGSVSYQYIWSETNNLGPRAFYRWYEQQNRSRFDSGANDTDVGNFRCSVEFVNAGGQAFKANVCARPYKRYPALNDYMVLAAMVGHEQQGFLFTLDLTSVTLENALQLTQRFLEQFQWQP